MNENFFLKISIISFIVGMLGLMMIDEFITVEDTKEIKTGEKAIVTGFVSRIEKFGGGYKLNLKNKDFEILIFTIKKNLMSVMEKK